MVGTTHTRSMSSETAATSRRPGRPGYDLDTLLAATVEVFIKKGFDGSTMEDLSQRLGISKSGIYHHVASKDALLELAVNRALDRLEHAVERTRALDATPIARLEFLIRESVRILIAQKPFVTLLLRVRGNTAVEQSALERRRHFDRYAATLVREAAEVGEVRPDIDPDVTARLLFGMVNSLVDWARPDGPDAVDQLADAVAAIAFDGILTAT